MAFLFRKFQEGVKVLAKSPTFAKEPRRLQFEADINRLFLYTSYNRLGKDAAEEDAEEIIELANNASIDDQQNQVQENIHLQTQNFVLNMDHILVRDLPTSNELSESDPNNMSPSRRSGLSLAVGQTTPLTGHHPVIPATHPLTRAEVSQKLKDLMGYTLELKPSKIPHKDAGLGLFINGEADVGSLIAFYPGVVYSPAYYRYIPGYPRFDTQNTYMITRYDGTVINAQPWGSGGETRGLWNGVYVPPEAKTEGIEKGSDKIWKMLSKPLDSKEFGIKGEILEKRNPLALGHYANHPGKDMDPNVMVCSYDFPLFEKSMRTYIPNISFGNGQEANMKRFGSFWFKSWKSGNVVPENPVLKSLVLVATRAVQDEEILVNYRLSNSKRRPSWYVPVDEEEDKRRWG